MKIFYAVQVSNTTKVNEKFMWLLRSDACINIMVGIVSSVLDVRKDWQFIIKVPIIQDIKDINSFYELFPSKYHKNISFYEEKIPISPMNSRFSFNFCDHAEYKDMFRDVDVMICDENTLTKNWIALFRELALNIPIVVTNYFMDSPFSWKVHPKVRYYERQMEALTCADMFVFPCNAAMNQAIEAYHSLFKESDFLKMAEHRVWGTGVHAKEVEQNADVLNMKRTKKPIVYFGNRITETAGSYTNWQAFAKAVGLLHQRGIRNFEAIMLNPTKKVNQDQMKAIIDWSFGQVIVKSNDEPFTREDYLRFINEASISCNLFTKEVHGGLTSYEAMIAENIIVCPEMNDYKDRFEGFQYPYFCKVDKDLHIDIESLADAIKKAVDMVIEGGEKWIQTRKMVHKIAYDTQSYEHAAEQIAMDIEYLNKKKVEA